MLTGTCDSLFADSSVRRSETTPVMSPEPKIATEVCEPAGVEPTSYAFQKSCGL